MTPIVGRKLTPNHASRIPRTHIVLDSEAIVTPDATGETHTFRCAVTSCDKMSRKTNDWLPPEYQEHNTSQGVWEWITDRAKPRERTVVVAHNAGYDLRITEAFSYLPQLGWTLGMFSLAPGATWTSWKRDSATLSCVDSLSWFPTTLQNIGKLLGMDKPTLPGVDDDPAVWLKRCRADVAILRRAWLDAIQWLRDEDCGNFKPTGAGMAFAAFRHKHLTHNIVTHNDNDLLNLERRAAWTGRAEPWRFGSQSDGPFYEWDYTCAYATIAAECNVPTQYLGPIDDIRPGWEPVASDRRAILCQVDVSTETPLVPCEKDGRIFWPVGQFSTVLWDHELRLLSEHGEHFQVSKAWTYRTAPALKQWAEWVLALVSGRTEVTTPIARIMAKHWCRSLIGRFGSRFPTWETYGVARNATPSLSGLIDSDTGETAQLLEVGGAAWKSAGVTDHPMACPQIMSWIMAESRVRLWHAIETAGRENVVYVDTDSLITTPRGSNRLECGGIPGLRKKAEYRTLDIHGTRRLIQNQQLKAAGIPRGAIRLGQNTWSAQSWNSLAVSLGSGQTGSVRVSDRSLTLRDKDARRIDAGMGRSTPYRIGDQ